MATEKITLYRVSEDKQSTIEQLPKTVASQVYNEGKSEFLDKTLSVVDERYEEFEVFKNSKGQPDGLSTLGPDGLVPTSQLPNMSSISLIAEVKGDGSPGTTTISFSNIPQNFKKIFLIISNVKSLTTSHITASVTVLLNGVTGSYRMSKYTNGQYVGATTGSEIPMGSAPPSTHSSNDENLHGVLELVDYNMSDRSTIFSAETVGTKMESATPSVVMSKYQGFLTTKNVTNSLSVVCTHGFTTSSIFSLYGVK